MRNAILIAITRALSTLTAAGPSKAAIAKQDRRERAAEGDRPLWKIGCCPIRMVFPEAYINMRVEPGKDSQWSLPYDFYVLRARQ